MIFHILGDWVDGKPSGLHYWMKYHLEEAKGKKQIMKIYIDEDLLDRFTIALGRSC